MARDGVDGLAQIELAELTALITAAVAVVSFLVTSILNRWESKLKHFQETANNVASTSAGLRSVGLENIAHYLGRRRFMHTARRILVNSLLFEEVPQLRDRTRDLLLSSKGTLNHTLVDLVSLNRATWQLMVETVLRDGPASTGPAMDQLRGTLQVTKEAISAILRQTTVEDVDLSNTRLDGANLAGVRLIRANMTGATLSFCSLHGATLRECTAAFAVFSGAYMEEARLENLKLHHSVLSKTRFDRTVFTHPRDEEIDAYFSDDGGLEFSSEEVRRRTRTRVRKNDSLMVFLGQELSWHGVWVTESNRRLSAYWESPWSAPVSAQIVVQDHDGLRRTHSSDGNDGHYRIEHQFPLDPPMAGFALVTGSRMLVRDGIERSWHAIRWEFAS